MGEGLSALGSYLNWPCRRKTLFKISTLFHHLITVPENCNKSHCKSFTWLKFVVISILVQPLVCSSFRSRCGSRTDLNRVKWLKESSTPNSQRISYEFEKLVEIVREYPFTLMAQFNGKNRLAINCCVQRNF